MAKDLQSLSLLDIIPPNLQKDPNVCAAAKAIDQELRLALSATKEALHLPRINELPEPVIDLLAWQWHVDFYEPLGLSINRKRELVRQSIAWHRYKGTPAVVEDVVKAAYGNCKLTEWYEYNGDPGKFKVKVILEEESTDKNRWKNVISAINSVKNTRSWLEDILFYYPPIHMPVEIRHRAEIMQIVDAHHCVWNLGAAKFVRRDGVHRRDGTTRRSGIAPDGGYRTGQVHRAEIDLLVDATMQNNGCVVNRRDGGHLRNGSHMRNGAYRKNGMVGNYCTITSIKNGEEVVEFV